MSFTALVTRCRHHTHSNTVFRRRGLATITDAPKKRRLGVGIVLNRAPILTRTPTKFEQVFYKYQARIQRALHNPFPIEFYFKQGSVLEAQFHKEEAVRERKAFGWIPRDAKEKAALAAEVNQEEEESPRPRRTSADDTNDAKSLDRAGSRNLYLLVKSPGDRFHWRFPKGYVEAGELLHQAALRDLQSECGPDMNTWVVGRRPIGFFEYDYDAANGPYSGEKLFFYKAHIFAGQAKVSDSGISDFAWLTKDEIESRVSKEYWEGTRDMLSDS